MSHLPLSLKELQEKAPTLFTDKPHTKVSDKYHFIPTIDVIKQIQNENWYPMYVAEATVRDKTKEGYQQHLVRFRHLDDILTPKENAIELLLFNSHDRSKSFSISAGIYRFACANGLVIADSEFESYTIKHLGERANDVVQAVHQITAIKSALMQKIQRLESIQLTEYEKASFAISSTPLRFEEHLQIDFRDLLTPHREEDTKDDLYTVLNVIQENLLRGNISGINKESGRRFTSREISSISKDKEINQGLWRIAERIASVKALKEPLAA